MTQTLSQTRADQPRPSYPSRVIAMLGVAVLLAQVALARRISRLRNDRGDIPGWAIAAGASCVFGLLIWGAVSGTISKYITDITNAGN